jgi:hypothetical protein
MKLELEEVISSHHAQLEPPVSPEVTSTMSKAVNGYHDPRDQ